MAADSNSDNPLDQLRLSLMQDVLPVGLAVLERARQGGPGKVVEAFTQRHGLWQIVGHARVHGMVIEDERGPGL